jgi:hypothetical protein
MFRSRLLLLAALLGMATPALALSPASAAPPVFDDFTEQFSNPIDDYCDVTGLSVVDAGTFHDRLRILTKHSGLAYFLEHITVDETVTGAESGTSVRIHTAFVQKDLKVTDNGDGTLTIVSLATGPSTAYGPDGKAIARDPGQSRFRLVVSDSGTPDDPEDDVELSFDRIKGSTGRTDDYCAAIVPVID